MSLSEKQEKALLEAIKLTLAWIVHGSSDIAPYRQMRSILATLEEPRATYGVCSKCGAAWPPGTSHECEKPEPKRGVDTILCGVIEDTNKYPYKDELRDALRLYREERERVQRALDYLPHTPHVAESILKDRAI